MNLTVCREHGRSPCTCHPDATHRHYNGRTGGWREHYGHAHSIIAPDGVNTHCTHEGCDYRGKVGSMVTIRWAW